MNLILDLLKLIVEGALVLASIAGYVLFLMVLLWLFGAGPEYADPILGG